MNATSAPPGVSVAGQYQARIAAAKARIAEAYRHTPGTPPLLTQDVNYWMDGEVPDLIPADYFTNPAAMTDFQVNKIRRHLESIEDDYVPFLMPWFGTTVVPSALGCEVVYKPDGDPSLRGPILTSPADIAKLQMPDPYRDGQMPVVLAAIDYMRATTDLPVGVTDAQGPLNIALSIAGVEKLFMWMYDDAPAVHALMDFCTEALIEWIRVQKLHAGQPLDGGAFPTPSGCPTAWAVCGFRTTTAAWCRPGCTVSSSCHTIAGCSRRLAGARSISVAARITNWRTSPPQMA